MTAVTKTKPVAPEKYSATIWDKNGTQNHGLPREEKMVALALCSLTSTSTGRAKSTLNQLGTMTGYPIATVHRAINRLVNAGWLNWTNAGNGLVGSIASRAEASMTFELMTPKRTSTSVDLTGTNG